MIQRAFRYRLAPTPEQEMRLAEFVGVTRFVYNLCLEQRRDYWRQYRRRTGSSLNYASQGREVTALRREFDWMAACPTSATTQALRDLDRAFANFFAGRARFPGFRRKGENDSFRIQWKECALRPINRRWAAIRITNLGWIKLRLTRPIRGTPQSVTISRSSLGWHASIACVIEHVAPVNDGLTVGIDRGISISLVLSNGETFHLPKERLRHLDRQRRRAQRVVCRRKRGSNRRRKQLCRCARISARIARVRAHWQHHVTRDIASRFGLVVMEDLRVRNMSAAGGGAAKRGLNRSILEQGWAAFAAKLAYKLEERGGTLELINPAFTSQTCSDCGAIDSESRKNQASFVCTSCGFALNADRNAAINILRRSTSVMPVEGRDYAPVEAGTMLEAA